jgi:GntR family transcriptional regulator
VSSPILQVERTTRDATGRTVEFPQPVYRCDCYRIIPKLGFDATSGWHHCRCFAARTCYPYLMS